MTKEELEKEIKNYIDKNCKQWETDGLTVDDIVRVAVLDFAEPREKQIQIDAEQIRALQKQNGEFADNVKELEKEIKEWKDKADLWCKTANLKDHNIMINKELEKENAELKEKVNILDNCDRLGDVITEAYKEQLTKAKELLERFLGLGNLWDLDCKDYFPLRKEVEQFLKEVEK